MNYFLDLYNQIIHNTVETEERIPRIVKNVTEKIYRNICRGLFNEDKFIFSITLSSFISIREKKDL